MSQICQSPTEKPSRAVKPETARQQRATLPTFSFPANATIRQLHQEVARHLKLVPNFEDSTPANECNCSFARKLSDHQSSQSTAGTFFLIHGKSVVESLQTSLPTNAALLQSLQERFGTGIASQKRLHFLGGEEHADGQYTRLPVIAVCSLDRHIPAHARSPGLSDESNQVMTPVLDLHTSELPIHASSMDRTLKESGLLEFCTDGLLEVFAVQRNSLPGPNAASIGKDALFRSRAHWNPPVNQSHRGTAMFLSSLRVTASLVQDMDEDFAAQDAVLHTIDLITAFPPAVRALYLLAQGKTLSPPECAALSHSVFYALERFMPTDLIGTNRDRLFEGSRLFFGFLLEKARGLKLHSSQLGDSDSWPYLNAFKVLELRDFATNEPLIQPVQTHLGIVERNYYNAFALGGLLESNTMQPAMVESHLNPEKLRLAVLNGGMSSEITRFSRTSLLSRYVYDDAGNFDSVIDSSELNDLHYLAELCGRNRLAVQRPSQLASTVSPCLTFDRNAHVAVYLGEQGCGEPGHSSLVFRPVSGTETVDTAVVEQLIAPIIRAYEADGTRVFDASGGSTVRKLEAPDEILIFCVDCSASMGQATDFEETIHDEEEDDPQADPLHPTVEGEYFAQTRYEDATEELSNYESFADMVAIVADAAPQLRSSIAIKVLTILGNIVASQLSKKIQDIEHWRHRLRHNRESFFVQHNLSDLEMTVRKQKGFYAGLRTHEEKLRDFLIYRAQTVPPPSVKWSWTPGDEAPSLQSGARSIPILASSVIEIPDELRCPISQDVLLDPVKAADGHTYSRQALQQWFNIRKSSPLHGTPLEDTSVAENEEVARAAQAWVDGQGLIDAGDPESRPSKKRRSTLTGKTNITFDSAFGAFERCVPKDMALIDLYRLAFRGLNGRHSVFQLLQNGNLTIAPSSNTVASLGLQDEVTITIGIADDNGESSTGTNFTNEPALIKVYSDHDEMAVAYWVDRYTSETMASILWKYWRAELAQHVTLGIQDLQVWTDLSSKGDGMGKGSPCLDHSAHLAAFLNRNHCSGHLGIEDVFVDSQGGSGQTLVLKVMVQQPWRKPKRSVLSRLDVLKQMFEALINRLLAYNYRTHVGLVTISSEANLRMPISHVIENFRRTTNDMMARGDTALFDALALARDQLNVHGEKYPDARKRIICISDGVDTKSISNTAEGVAWKLLNDGIAVDSISLGDEHNAPLRAISHILGCYKLEPYTLVNALSMCELEPFLALVDRPDVIPALSKYSSRRTFRDHFQFRALDAAPTTVNEHDFPERKEHSNLRDGFVPLADAARAPHGQGIGSSGGAKSNLRTTRLLNEMRQIVVGGPRENYDVYISETDMSFWKVVMQGPSGTPYEKGTFLLYVHAEDRYPALAPKARFVTQIRHPNVTAHGRICHSILDRDWTSDTSMTRLLDTIFGMLFQAETTDPVNTMITLDYHHDQVEFHDEVREWVEKYATRTREEWKSVVLEGEDWDDDAESDADDDDDDVEMDY